MTTCMKELKRTLLHANLQIITTMLGLLRSIIFNDVKIFEVTIIFNRHSIWTHYICVLCHLEI